MKATYYIKDPAVSADFFCIFNDIADPGMGTARDDYEPCLCPVHQGRVVWKEVGNFVSLAVLNISDSCLCLKDEVSGDFPQENEPLAQPDGNA